MSDIKYSTNGLRHLTQLTPPVKLRLFGFMFVVICGGVLLGWLTHTTWEQLDHLKREHAAVRSGSFYLGVSLRGNLRSLNEKLLQFGHSPTPSTRAEFLQESSDLKAWLATNRLDLAELAKLPLLKQVAVDDLDILDQLQAELEHYLVQSASLLALTNPPASALSFEARYRYVQQLAAPLLRLSDQLVAAQREDFSDFLAETQANLAAHQRLLQLTVVLILALAVMLALLVYRGMIAPLRLGLRQSKTIIERQEKLASLGVLASGVAHEIRNPLTAIKFRLFSLKKTLPALAGNEDASVIGDEINRLERIVKDFLGFARPSEPALAALPAQRILQDTQALLQGQLEKSGIKLRLQLESSPWVHADAHQMKQVLINLIRNAAEAIGRNGRITLGLRTDLVLLQGRCRPAAILAVADSGQGIAPEIEARLFDPFFTTKEGGTGLGLAIASRIVDKHGGLLRYQTELNRGTTFEVVLPQVEHDASETAAH